MKYYILGVFAFLLLLFLLRNNNNSHSKELEKYWEERHYFFKNSEASPFVQKNEEYKDVPLFPFNVEYRVQGVLKRFDKREIIQLSNSDGGSSHYIKFASVSFKIQDTTQTLLILKPMGFSKVYLTAFGDATSGITTYGGGRYLDLDVGKSSKIVIDFNKAYNPYCAYFDDYSCPLPPSENLLNVAIEVGERITDKANQVIP